MAIVSCPDCGKKLKVADASVGRKVKCSCGQVFVAEIEEAPPVKKPAAPLTPEKVFVSCTDCDAKLKVGTTSLGKKMKCPKCAAVFVASLPAPTPAKKKAPLAELNEDDLDDAPKPKGKAKPAKDDMDDLFAFAQDDAERESADDDRVAAPRRGPGGKPKKKWDPDEEEPEEDAPKPKGKAKKPVKPPVRKGRRADEDEDEDEEEAAEKKKPVYPSRLVLNVLVAFMLLGYLGLLVDVFVFNLHDVDLYGPLGLAKPKPFKPAPILVNPGKKGDDKKETPVFAARQKEEKTLLEGYRKNVRPDIAGVVATFQPKNPRIQCLAFSPAGSTIATYADGGDDAEAITLWDLQSLKPSKSIPFKSQGVDVNHALAFSPDGSLLAIYANAIPGLVKVWNTKDGTEARIFEFEEKTMKDLAFSPDGKLMIAVIVEPGKSDEVKIWTVADWKEGNFNSALKQKDGTFLAPDGNKVIEVGEEKGMVAVHDVATWKVTEMKRDTWWTAPPSHHYGVSLGGRYVAVSSDKLRLFDLDKNETSILLDREVPKFPVFSPDARYLMCQSEKHDLLIDVAERKVIWSDPWSGETSARNCVFSPGGLMVARRDQKTTDGMVHLLSVEELLVPRKDPDKKDPDKKDPDKKDPDKKDPDKKDPGPGRDYYKRQQFERETLTGLKKMSFDPEDLPVSSEPTGVVGQLKHKAIQASFAFSPAAPTLAALTIAEDQVGIILWDLTSLKPSRTIPVTVNGAGQRPLALAFSPDGTLLAYAGHSDKFLKVWKVADGSLVKSIDIDIWPQTLAFSHDGKYLTLTERVNFAAKGKKWAVADWKEHPLLPNLGKITDLNLSEDGGTIAEWVTLEGVRIHDLRTGASQKLKLPDALFTRSETQVNSKYIARPSSKDNKHDLEILDHQTGQSVWLPKDAKSEYRNIHFTPDGDHLFVDVDGTCRLIECRTAKELHRTKTDFENPMAISPGGVFVVRSGPGAAELLSLDELRNAKNRPVVKKEYPKIDENERKEARAKQFLARQQMEKDWLLEWRKATKTAAGESIPLKANALAVEISFASVAPRLAISTTDDAEPIQIWDLQTLKLIRSIPVARAGLVALSPDGELIAGVTDGSKFIKVWKVGDGEEVKSFPMKREPSDLVFTQDGKWLLVFTATGADVKMFDTATWKETRFNARTDPDVRHDLAGDPDKLLEVRSDPRQFVLHDVISGQAKRVPAVKLFGVNTWRYAISPDSRHAAFEEMVDKTRELRIVDLDTGAISTLYADPAGALMQLIQFSPDSKHVLFETRTEDNKASFKVIELASKKVHTFPCGEPTSASRQFSPGGVFVARNVKETTHLFAFEDLISGKKFVEKKTDDEKKIDPKKDDSAAEKFVKATGGQLIRDDTQPGKPVIVAALAGSKLTDADLPALLAFPHMKKLLLESTKVTGVGVKDLAGLKNLEYLDMGFAPISDEGAKEIAELKQLKSLTLTSTKLTDAGVKELVGLTGLQELRLNQNKISDAGLKDMLAGLKELRRLEVGNTQAGDESAKALAGHEHLQMLRMSGSKLSDEGMKSFASLQQLQELHVSFNITDKGVKHLAELKELRVLSVFATQVGDAGLKELAGLTEMRSLDLTGTQVSDKGLAHLAGMKELETLKLDGTSVTDAGLKSIVDLKKLQFVALADTKVSDKGLMELAQLPELDTLILRNAKAVTDAGVANLKKALPKCNVIR